MRFTFRILMGLLLTLSTTAFADTEESTSETFASLIAEGHASEKRLHRQLLRALGAQNLPMQAAIEARPSDSSEVEVKLVPNNPYK